MSSQKAKSKKQSRSAAVVPNLEGTTIRKRFAPGLWREGVIDSVWEEPKGTYGCRVKYNDNNGGSSSKKNGNDVKEEEELPVDATLDLWITAQTMASIATKYSSAAKDADDEPPLALFRRNDHKSRRHEPYSVSQFSDLLEYACQQGDTSCTTLEDLERHKLVKTMSNPTEVYGRMLPQAIHVSCLFCFGILVNGVYFFVE